MVTKVGSDSLQCFPIYAWLQRIGVFWCQKPYLRSKENPTHQSYTVSLSSVRA